ncbi:MAG TPA: carboxyl transferase domain-containing protein [Solirubrobacteraceae bacterium]
MSVAAYVEAGPLERLEALCDPGTLRLIRTGVASRRMGEGARAGDGVLGGAGRVGGRPVLCFAQDPGYAGGSLGEAHADTIVRVLRLAGQAGAPVVGFAASGGARMQEGLAALGGYGRIFAEHVRLAGRVPQISVVAGTSAGGGAYAPALTDVVVMTEESAMFLTGPAVVREAVGEAVTAAELGGPRVHERSGVCQLTVPDAAAGARAARELVGLLGGGLAAPAAPLPGDPGDAVPAAPRRAYDVRSVIERVVDGGALLELSGRWARNVVTGLARLEGRAVGVVANQPRHLGGVLDAAASEKAARFVGLCDAFGVPLVVLVDTPGFLPGVRQETAGVIRHGAGLLRAFAAARVPKLTVVLRKAYGGAAITMNSRDLGADLVLAWPGAEIGVMAASQAVAVAHRRALAAAPDPEAERARLAGAYAGEHLRAAVAARDGFVDELIAPAATRDRLVWALDVLGARR